MAPPSQYCCRPNKPPWCQDRKNIGSPLSRLEEAEDVVIALEECLLDGLPFISGTDSLKIPEGYNTLGKVVKVVMKYPFMPFKILGYTGKPAGRWRTRDLCVKLALLRARAVRRALEERGCRNSVAAKGMGFTDNLGPRIEIIPCSSEDVQETEEQVLAIEAANGDASVEQELRNCLQKEGITFDIDSAGIDSAGMTKLSKVAEILSRHPDLVFRIVGYAEADASADLALRRSSGVRQSLIEAGCTCTLVVDSAAVELPSGCGRARVEVEVAAQAHKGLPQPAASSVANADRRRKTVVIMFDSPESGLQRVGFTRKPLGLSYQNVAPLVVTKVHPNGHAEELGVKAGWEFRMISTRHVSGLDISEIQETLIAAINQLPLSLSSSSTPAPSARLRPDSEVSTSSTSAQSDQLRPNSHQAMVDESEPLSPDSETQLQLPMTKPLQHGLRATTAAARSRSAELRTPARKIFSEHSEGTI